MNTQATITTSESFLLKQFPYRLLQSDPLFCEWICNTNENFTEPFFDETIARLKTLAKNQKLFRSIAAVEMLPGWASGSGIDRTPTAIIFHVSRCGSTLLSQLLALQQKYMVLSEVPLFDGLLRLPFKDEKISKTRAAELFHAALQLYVNSSIEQPAHIFLKTDSWHLHFYQQIRELYPQVPFLLLYREPWEVMQSQQRRRGMQSVPGVMDPAIFNFTAEESAVYDLDRYMAQVLHSYFKKMIDIVAQDKRAILINYNEGAVAAMQTIAKVSQIEIDVEYEKLIQERAGFHGKYPGEVFKEAENSEAAQDYLLPTMHLYKKLEEIRVKHSSM